MEKLNKDKSSKSWKYLLPISFIVFLVPLIVFLKVVDLTPIEIAYWKGGSQNPDFFSYYKMVVLNILTIIGIIFAYIYTRKNNIKLKKTKIYIPMAIYSIFVILSTLFSSHKTVALWGFADRYEGMFVLLSYMAIMLISINLVNDEKSAKAILYPLIASASIIGIIGIFQYIGYDFFQTDFGKKIILPGKHRDIADNLKFNFGKNTIYSTLYNTNYVGSYMAMLAPMLLTLLILVKGIKKKLILVPLTLLMFLSLVGSNSRGGMFGAIISLLILLIMLRKQIFKRWKIVIVIAAILSIGIIKINKISDGRLLNQSIRLKNDIVELIKNEEVIEDPNAYKIKEISQGDNTLNISTTNETLKIRAEGDSIMFSDGNDNDISIEYDSETGNIKLLDEKYAKYKLKLASDGEHAIIELNLSGYIGRFALIDNEFKYYRRGGIFKPIEDIESYGFEGKESLGSNRGYIWSRTLPMLKENIMIGKGPDTYPIYFPQEDFKGRFNVKVLSRGMIVDKPHNLYLQIGTNTGVVSLISFLAIVFIYLVQSIVIYFKDDLEGDLKALGLGIFVAVFGYLIAGMFNDSVVSVAPVFWVLLGTGIAINLKIKIGGKI